MPRALQRSSPTPVAPDNAKPLRLPLLGPARIEWNGQSLRLRRKSLAILYYLAVEGATRRLVLADLLWEQLGASQNLRVELHHLRKTLADFGVSPFEGGIDPLVLPAGVQLDRNGHGGLPLEGLEGLSPQFQAWLEEQRAVVGQRTSGRLVHRDLVEELAGRVQLPYLVIISAEPDSGQDSFVASLAIRLGLRKTDELNGGGKVLRYLSAARRFDDGVVRTIVEDEASLWVIEQPSFGEDSAFLLKLRGNYPPDRLTYLRLPPLTWRELQGQLQSTLPFRDAAELYTLTGGHPGYLREALELRKTRRAGEAARLPQRIRAAYQLEARRLSLEARFALERASVHPGPLSDGLLHALEVEPHLIELERRNWLVLEEGWRFRGNVPRTAIYLSLSRGQMQLYHRRAADYLESNGNHLAAQYHRSFFGERIDWRGASAELTGWARQLIIERAGDAPAPAPKPERLVLKEESPLLESRWFGEQVEAQAGEVVIVRRPLEVGLSGAEWQLLIPSGVLHLRGRAYARNSLDAGLDGDEAPLTVEFLGAAPRTVVYAPVDHAQALEDGSLLLPLQEELDSYLKFEECLFVRITSNAEAAVIELTLTAYGTGAPVGGGGVEVL